MARSVQPHTPMSFWNDFRYGARKLRKAPGFAATSIITLALGIGATTAIFSVCDAMLWKPVPLPEIDRLAMVLNADPNDPNDWDPLTFADLEDLRAQTKSFRDITWWGYGLANIVGSNGESERVEQSLVGPNFFEVIGVQPVIGRGFQAGEDTAGRERVVVLSNGLWRRLFSSDPNVAGKTMRFDDEDYTVVGVMPANFEFPKTAQVWTPYAPTAEQRHSRTAHTVSAFGRLAPEATLASARSEMVAAGARLEREHPESNKNRRFRVDSLHDFLVGSYNRNYSELLFGASLFVLLIACANIANLQFARASGRTRELAVRTALGASRWRLMSQVLAESLLISLAGAAAGLLIASWGIEMIRGGMPAEVEKYITGWKSMGLDARALAFTLAVAVATGLLAGLAPAFQSARARVSEALKEGSRGSAGRGRHRVRGLLVAAQITLAVVLLVGASLMVRGFNALISASERFEPATLLTFRLAVTATKYKTPVQRTAFYREVIAHAQAIPGVRSVAAATALPHSNHSSGQAFDIEGKQFDPSNQPGAMYQSVNPAFFETTHTALRSGRLLQPGDGADTPRVAVISVRMAERWWPGEPLPVGRRIRVHGQEQWMTIAGVVDNIPHEVTERSPRSVVYVPYEQTPRTWMDLAVRTTGNPTSLASAVRAAVRAVDPEQPVTDIATMETLISRQATGLTYVAVLMGVFGVIALVLSSVGVYGVMAYLVSEQTNEIGIRMALGAGQGNVLQMIFRRGLVTTGFGLAVGIGLAYWMARVMSSLIFGVTAGDPASFVGIPLALLASAALAIYVPARRAMKIDPLVALRHE